MRPPAGPPAQSCPVLPPSSQVGWMKPTHAHIPRLPQAGWLVRAVRGRVLGLPEPCGGPSLLLTVCVSRAAVAVSPQAGPQRNV